MKNKYCILCVKNCLLKIMKDVALEICKVRLVKLFLVKRNSIFGAQNEKNIFSFYGRFIFNMILKISWAKKFE